MAPRYAACAPSAKVDEATPDRAGGLSSAAMRIVTTIAVMIALVGLARAEPRLVRDYAGQIVISPDPVPTDAVALEAFVKANATKDRKYALLRPPWQFDLVGFLARD